MQNTIFYKKANDNKYMIFKSIGLDIYQINTFIKVYIDASFVNVSDT